MAPTSRSTASRVQALDLLRLVAVFGVVLFHYGFRGPSGFGATYVAIPALAAFARYGFLGVPVFFVISGFVIAYSAEGRTASGFAIARIARIYPTFLVCMTLTCLAVVAFGVPRFETSFAQWSANLFIAAPVLRENYMDSAYWSLVIEITFYAWVAVLITAKLFPRRIDLIVLVWLALSMANELTIDAAIVEKIFLADYSGFFATGLMIYELFRGRRDAMVQLLLALSVGTAVFQAIHNLGWLRYQTGMVFDDAIVAATCLLSISLIIWATRIRRMPLPPKIVLAAGGLTYPLYLLHQQIGYTLLTSLSPTPAPSFVVAILCGLLGLSWIVWRYFEQPAQRWAKLVLTACVGRLGSHAKPQLLP
jgi:peptidoglycan/LPS O-acetylase OafA/YrhL